jgi:lysyl-tRNA synthetase class I
MFYVGSEPVWKQYAQDGWLNEQISKMLDEIVGKYPMEVTYENISLGEVKMA